MSVKDRAVLVGCLVAVIGACSDSTTFRDTGSSDADVVVDSIDSDAVVDGPRDVDAEVPTDAHLEDRATDVAGDGGVSDSGHDDFATPDDGVADGTRDVLASDADVRDVPSIDADTGVPDSANHDGDCLDGSEDGGDCVPALVCPDPDDPRVAAGSPFVDYELRGGDFYVGTASSWSWVIEGGGPCESVLPRPSFTISNSDSENATFRPTLSGDYTVTMTIVTDAEVPLACTWQVSVGSPGLRIEMCYPESETQDLDLFLSQPGYTGNWYIDTDDAFQPAQEVCGWHNCSATVRGTLPGGGAYPRADWGYANSPPSKCSGSQSGAVWVALGYCANPRLELENNLSEGVGVAENINIDAPAENQRFRVMVQNFSGTIATPVVNVYCGGSLAATYGAEPDSVTGFAGVSGFAGIGAMWRVVDVTTHVDSSDATTCDVEPVHRPGETTGYDITFHDVRF